MMEYQNLDLDELAGAAVLGFKQSGSDGFQFAISEFVRIFTREWENKYGTSIFSMLRLRLNLGMAVSRIHALATARIAAQQD